MARILLVDDDEAARDVLQHALEHEGHEVVVAGDGREAMDLAASSGTIDLLVSDISMPEVDGVSLAENLLAKTPGLPVVLMSAISDELARAQALSEKTVRVLSKPVTLEQLRTEVNQALGR